MSDLHEYEDKYIDAGGISTRYIERGEGAPLILVHGGGAGADCVGNWFSTIPSFADRYRVIAPDMVGFGKTDKPNGSFEYTQNARTEHLIDFIEAMGFDKVALVGNSMGGATALAVASERPDLVERLVLMGSAGLVAQLSEEVQTVVRYDFTREGMVRIIKALTAEGYDVRDEMVDHRMKLASDEDTKRAYAATMQWIKDRGGFAFEDQYVANISAPTLVINGKDDKVVPIDNAYKFLDLIPNSWGYIIPHCGHWAMLEKPSDFANAVNGFLSQEIAA